MLQDIRQNIRDLRGATNASVVLTGLLVVIVGYASSLPIAFQAAAGAGLSPSQTSSWIMAITIGSGLCSIIMSIWFRQPVMAAWSTPGLVLLVSGLALDNPAHYTLNEAVGAYIIVALASILLGLSGLFGRLMAMVPQPVVLGMLAGVLIRFGFGLFTALPERPVMVIAMLIAFFVLRRRGFRAPTVGVLAVGLLLALVTQDLHVESVQSGLVALEWTAPVFSVEALLGLGLPLFALAMSSQNAPGQAVLRAAGYQVPINGALVVTGVVSLLTAPFGGHGLTLAAITAAMVTGPEAHPDPDKRYAAGVAAGVGNIVTGIFGATLVSLFAVLPHALIAATAGLALTGAIISSLSGSMAEPSGREGGVIALMCTAANFTLFGIGAPFWGLVMGVLTHEIMTRQWIKKEQ
ncbi:MAG: benzoate/H(+) symporter BenE family transporter [Anaerolineae bacterium]|nr:benzoate/H(+) symporter BenE family transporter [Anaerolineae bacterium]